ncbi:MAG: CAP domain-containing protein [Oscillospiraceae bacterium]|nr:CAP domain-containing protein [Oscillospiraceae bacterium]
MKKLFALSIFFMLLLTSCAEDIALDNNVETVGYSDGSLLPADVDVTNIPTQTTVFSETEPLSDVTIIPTTTELTTIATTTAEITTLATTTTEITTLSTTTTAVTTLETTTVKMTTTPKVTTIKQTTTPKITTIKQVTTSKVTTVKETTTTNAITVGDNNGNSLSIQVFNIVNKERVAVGLPELTYSYELEKAANTRAEELTKSFSHTRPDGRDCFSVYDDYGIRYGYAAENIAWGQKSSSEVMQAWMNSSGHRGNILSPNLTKLGVGVYFYNGTYYWVQNFS